MRLILLSQSFYQRYSNCSEILIKDRRPYICLQVRVQNRDFAIPLRHHINHKYAFFTVGKCGLDYTKAVPIMSQDDIDEQTPTIDSSEFQRIKGKEQIIENGLANYIAVYKKAMEHSDSPFYQTILRYSALQYFEDVLL